MVHQVFAQKEAKKIRTIVEQFCFVKNNSVNIKEMLPSQTQLTVR